jgi:hypothetical protein
MKFYQTVTLGFAGILLSTSLAPAQTAAQTIQVESAMYGTVQTPAAWQQKKFCNTKPAINLTTAMQAACNGNSSCQFKVPMPSHQTDPGYGCYKNFTATYKCGSSGTAKTVSFGGKYDEASGSYANLKCETSGGSHGQSGDTVQKSVNFLVTRKPGLVLNGSSTNWTMTGVSAWQSGMSGLYSVSGPVEGEQTPSQTLTQFTNTWTSPFSYYNFKQAACILRLSYNDPALARGLIIWGGFDDVGKTVSKVSRINFYFRPESSPAATSCISSNPD